MSIVVRRPSRRRFGVAVVVLMLAGVMASLVSSSAAQLNLSPVARQHAEQRARCDLDGVALTTPGVSGTTTRLDVSGIDASCAGLPIVVRVATGATASSSTTAVIVPAGGGSMTLSTANPAFDPAAVVQTSVTIGGWPMSGTWTYTPPAPTSSCRVLTTSGGETGRPCIVLAMSTPSFWGTGDAQQGNFSLDFSAPGIQNNEYVEFTFVVPTAILPAGWSWNGKIVTINNLGSSGDILSRCSELPTIRARFGNNRGDTLNAHFSLLPGTPSGSDSTRCNP